MDQRHPYGGRRSRSRSRSRERRRENNDSHHHHQTNHDSRDWERARERERERDGSDRRDRDSHYRSDRGYSSNHHHSSHQPRDYNHHYHRSSTSPPSTSSSSRSVGGGNYKDARRGSTHVTPWNEHAKSSGQQSYYHTSRDYDGGAAAASSSSSYAHAPPPPQRGSHSSRQDDEGDQDDRRGRSSRGHQRDSRHEPAAAGAAVSSSGSSWKDLMNDQIAWEDVEACTMPLLATTTTSSYSSPSSSSSSTSSQLPPPPTPSNVAFAVYTPGSPSPSYLLAPRLLQERPRTATWWLSLATDARTIPFPLPLLPLLPSPASSSSSSSSHTTTVNSSSSGASEMPAAPVASSDSRGGGDVDDDAVCLLLLSAATAAVLQAPQTTKHHFSSSPTTLISFWHEASQTYRFHPEDVRLGRPWSGTHAQRRIDAAAAEASSSSSSAASSSSLRGLGRFPRSTLILMSDSRHLTSSFDSSDVGYHSLVAAINARYAEAHNFDFVYAHTVFTPPPPPPSSSSSSSSRPPYNPKTSPNCFNTLLNASRSSPWSKLLSMWACIGKGYDRVVYIDSDCAFVQPKRELQDYLTKAQYARNSTGSATSPLVFLTNWPWDDGPCSGFVVMRSCASTRHALAAWWNTSMPSRDTVHDFEQAALRTLLGRGDPAVSAPISGIVQDWMFRDKPPQFLRHIGSDQGQQRIPSFRGHYDRLWGKQTFPDTIAAIMDTGYCTVKTEQVEAELQVWVAAQKAKEERERGEGKGGGGGGNESGAVAMAAVSYADI